MNKILALIFAVLLIVVICNVYNYNYNQFHEDVPNFHSGDGVNELDIIDRFLVDDEKWVNQDLMPMGGIAGIYQTGYTFFDIDLDGEKELAVQLGGGTLHNCSTLFYEYESGEIKQKNFFDETYSLSVNDLSLFNNGSENFYINKYTLKIEPTKYITYYDKIYKENSGLKTENLFSIEEVYDENDEVSFTYMLKNEEVDSTTYYDEYIKYFENLQEDILVINFISSEDFKQMSDSEKKNSLEKAYGNESYEYVVRIKNDIIDSLAIDENSKTIDIALTKEIYGDEIEEFKKALEIEDDVSAQVITDEKNFVTIIPTPDFLNNQNYYFKDGKLVAYKEEFMGIGGSATYYFENDELIFIDETDVEEEMDFVSEDANSILKRANEAYKKYIK